MSEPEVEPPDAAEGDETARQAARITSAFVLRALKLITDLHEGDMLTAIVAQAIIAANTSHLDMRTGDGPRFAGLAAAPPDEARRPVSVLALSKSLGLPFETTRRHVKKLVEAGRCARVHGGVIVPTSAIEHPAVIAATRTHATYVRGMLRALKAAGVTAD